MDAGLASWTELDDWSLLDMAQAHNFLDAKQALEEKAIAEAQRKK